MYSITCSIESVFLYRFIWLKEMRKSFTLLFLCKFLLSTGNVVKNGNFQSGDLLPWRCHGDCLCHTSQRYLGDLCWTLSPQLKVCLAVTDRTETWNGPRQSLSSSSLTSQPGLYTLTFSIKVTEEVEGKWKLHLINGVEEQFVSLFSGLFSPSDWRNFTVIVDIDDIVTQVELVEILFEGSPASSDFYLDNISLQETEDDSWKEEANDRIEKFRKNNVEINFLDTDGTQLTVEVTQTSHLFPFGQAVDSPDIARCYDMDRDDNYCSYVKNNFNMITDTYRYRAEELNTRKCNECSG